MWKVKLSKDDAFMKYRILDVHDRSVALTTTLENANLIVCAPELLEALKSLSGDIMALNPVERAKRFLVAIEAIAKAEGDHGSIS